MEPRQAEFAKKILELSLELRDIKRPLRVLASVRWPPELERDFRSRRDFAARVRKMYAARGPTADARRIFRELDRYRLRVDRRLGTEHPCATILNRIAVDYQTVAQLIGGVGQPGISEQGRALWGSAHDQLFSDGTTIIQYARQLQRTIKRLITPRADPASDRVVPAAAVAELMRASFRESHLAEHIEVVLTNDITANAAAGNGRIKLKANAWFSVKDINVLIFHEAYTHVATTANGRAQPFAKWLGFDSPRCASTQEGLAVLMEIFSSSIYPQRLKKIADRVIAVGLAEEGAGPREVFEFYRGEGYHEGESYQLMSRAFRGTDLNGGEAFTKDVSYVKGLVECYNFIQYCLVTDRPRWIPYLFAGKVNVSEMPLIMRAAEHRLIQKPKWIPSPFQDVDALSSMFICNSALGQLGDAAYQKRFQP